MPVAEKKTLRFGPFVLDTQCGQLRRNGVGLKLQGQPVQILEILLENAGNLVTREEIRQRLWASDTFVDFDHSLNTAVKKLRQALGDEAETPRYIETLPKRGYRFIGEVKAEEARHENHSAPPIAAGDAVRQVVTSLADAATTAETEPRSRTRRMRVVMVSVVAFLGIATCGYWITKPPPMPRIVGSHALTNTGNQKVWEVRPLIDRGSVYFNEARPAGWVAVQASTAGDEPPGSLNDHCCLIDISRDGSQALWHIDNPTTKVHDVWVQSLIPTGTPRLVIQDAAWPEWSADGRSFFFVRNNYTELHRANVDGTGVEHLATVPWICKLHLSPDGSRIRFTGEFPAYPMWEVGADGSHPHAILTGHTDVHGGTWSSDGKYYFFTAWDGDRSSLWGISEVRPWWKKANASLPQQLSFGPMSVGVPAISKDGKQLYAIATERRGELSAYDSKSGKFLPYLGGQSICFVDFSRDGQWMAYVTYPEGSLWRSRIDGSERRQLTVPPMAVFNPRWSPDGKLIAFTDLSGGDRRQMKYFGSQRVYVVSSDGGSPMLLLADYFGDPTWSADGKSIAYHYFPSPGKSEVRILDLQSQKSTTVPASQGMWSPRWSPDGKYLVAFAWATPNKLMIYNFARNTWEELASSQNFGWPSWSHDSRFVYVQDGDSVVRIAVVDHKKEHITSLRGFRATAYYFDRIGFGWLGLTPEDRPLTTRDTGIQEMYAFDLEYK